MLAWFYPHKPALKIFRFVVATGPENVLMSENSHWFYANKCWNAVSDLEAILPSCWVAAPWDRLKTAFFCLVFSVQLLPSLRELSLMLDLLMVRSLSICLTRALPHSNNLISKTFIELFIDFCFYLVWRIKWRLAVWLQIETNWSPVVLWLFHFCQYVPLKPTHCTFK